MDRRKLLKITAVGAVGTILNPPQVLAQADWLIEILEQLFKALVIDLIEKPIAAYIKHELGLDTKAEEIKKKNEDYAEEGIFAKNRTYHPPKGEPGTICYPIATPTNVNYTGQYIVPFYNYDGRQSLTHVADFHKHETETMAWAAQHLYEKEKMTKEDNTKLILPHKLELRKLTSTGTVTQYTNKEGGTVILRKYNHSRLGICEIQSHSYSPDSPTTLPDFHLLT